MNLARRPLFAVIGGLALITVAAGCAAHPDSAPSPTVEQPTVTPTGMPLSDAGFTHGPAGFTIPGNVAIDRRVDQPNVVTLTFSPEDGAVVLAHLNAQLPAMGFVITARSNDSLVFHNNEWDGAFTISPELSGLSLRKQS